VRFDVLTKELLRIQVFWDMTVCQWVILEEESTMILQKVRNHSPNDTTPTSQKTGILKCNTVSNINM